MGIKHYIDSLRRGLRRPEVRKHPIQAISRRIGWRYYWKHSSQPMVLEPWWRGLKICLPHTSNASLLYYRTHSDPNLTSLLGTLLFPGMTFLDVGAHIGEYTLVGAHMVGSSGRVCAVEPLPPCANTVRKNAEINGMKHVQVYDGALCDYSGKIGFMSDSERSAGWIAKTDGETAFESPCWTLDDFLPHAGIERVDVIKLDAGGNELGALRGARKTLQHGILVMKLYSPAVIQERFGYHPGESVKLLLEMGLSLKLMANGNSFPIFGPDDLAPHFDGLDYSHLLLATRV